MDSVTSPEALMPLISVVLPVHNVEKYIERCFASISMQMDPDIELIFVDDCGSDRSMEIVESFSSRDPRVRIVRNPSNQGTLASRANGALASVGSYIFFVDPDDEISDDAFHRIKNIINTDRPDVIVTGVRRVPEARYFPIPYSVPKNADSPLIFKAAFLDVSKPYWGTPGKIYRREIVLRAIDDIASVGSRLSFGEDLLLYVLCLNYAKSLRSINFELYYYHSNPSSITKAASFDKLNSNMQQLHQIYLILLSYVDSGKVSGEFSREGVLLACSMLKRDMATLAVRMVAPLIEKDAYEFQMIGRYVVSGKLLFLVKAALSLITKGYVQR